MALGPSIELMKGMNKEAREEFMRAWANARWLTDPLKNVLEHKKDNLMHDLVYDVGDKTYEEIAAEIRALNKLLELLP